MSNRTIQVDDRLHDYLLSVSVREADSLRHLREQTAALGGVARMQISPEQGQLMALLVETLGVRRMLEVGTFTGYSTLACALALPPDGQITACDISREWTQMGEAAWEAAGVRERIDLRIGPAEETLKALLAKGQANAFDCMFIDADKGGYRAYYELGLQLVRPGGLILIDNVLWSGAVADENDQEPDTVAIRALNQHLHADPRVTLSLLPIGDGLTLARRRV